MLVECSEECLGGLQPPANMNNIINFNMLNNSCDMLPYSGDAAERRKNIINIPLNVLEELQRTGIPIGWYNHGELQDAILACSYDGTLIDDEEGETFRDRLVLTQEEKIQRERKKKLTYWRVLNEEEMNL